MRQVAASSTLPELPAGVGRGPREARDLADGRGDGDTVDLLTQIVTEFEKNAWFLRATAEAA